MTGHDARSSQVPEHLLVPRHSFLDTYVDGYTVDTLLERVRRAVTGRAPSSSSTTTPTASR